MVDEITQTRGQSNKECVGQGIGNVVTGFFGGMGGCAMIGQSMINVEAGGRTRLSSFSASIFLLISILFAAPLIEMIPVAALVGVMFMVVIGTFEWSSLRVINKIPRSDAFVLMLVSIVTVLTDLATAVVIGVIISALVFAWKKSAVIQAKVVLGKGKKTYKLSGPLFFGSIRTFTDLFDIKKDPENVYVDFKYSRVHDHSALEAIDNLTEKYAKAGKELHVLNVSHECKELLTKAKDITEINLIEDEWMHIASNKLG